MKDERIFEIPFWYFGKGVRSKHRNAEDILIRDTVLVSFQTMGGDDAPVQLRAEMRRDDKLIQALELRHDGSSYLRPADLVHGGGVFTEADLANLATTFARGFKTHDLPGEWLYRMHACLEDRTRVTFPRYHWAEPEAVETLESIAIRRWSRLPTDEARVRAIQSCSAFAIIDGVLHRRVPAPKWTVQSNGPQITGGEVVMKGGPRNQFTSRETGIIPVWPIRQAHLFEDYCNRSAGDAKWTCSANAPLEVDVALDRLEVVQKILPALLPYVDNALPQLSDAGLDVYKGFRVAAERCFAGDVTAAAPAMKALTDLVADGGMGERQAIESLADKAMKHLRRWEEIERDFAEGEALESAALAAL